MKLKHFAIIMFVIIGSISIGCKNRKLAIQKEKTETKTVEKEQVQAHAEITETKQSTTSETEQIRDQSGTWIWEEWYQKDLENDTLRSLSPFPSQPSGIIYKRTTFTKNDIATDRAKESTARENHTQVTDSTVVKDVVRQTVTESKKKDLEAKQSGLGWVWALVVLVVALIVFTFIFKRIGLK